MFPKGSLFFLRVPQKIIYAWLFFLLIFSLEGSPSRQGVSETEFMERIRERMAQEVGGYVSI